MCVKYSVVIIPNILSSTVHYPHLLCVRLQYSQCSTAERLLCFCARSWESIEGDELKKRKEDDHDYSNLAWLLWLIHMLCIQMPEWTTFLPNLLFYGAPLITRKVKKYINK